ncbi:MAG TPA: TIGR03435 family protein [Terracidiphilus sp.]
MIARGYSQTGVERTKSTQTAQPSAGPAFDVAAIHQHIPEPHEHNSIWSSPSDTHFRAGNVSLIGLIHWAFEMPETRILNAPGWARSTYFNIEASSGSSMDEKMVHLTSEAGRLQKEMMVRALLADRFKLAAHFETRELPIYDLVVAKGTPKLGEAKLEGTTVNHWRDHLEVQGGDSLALLAEELSKEVGRPVIDKTGIAGRYNLKVRWTPDGLPANGSSAADAPPSIFTALNEQLGLKLNSGKGPVQVLVIDHVEMPSEN